MKINDLHRIQPKQPDLKGRSDISDPKADFNAVLKETVGNTDGARNTSKTSAVVHPFATMPINPISLPALDQTVPLIDRIDRFVDLLDDYRQQLADPRASLKTIQPLMDNIAAAKEGLASELDGLGDGNALKEVLNASLVTATTEIMHFNRGDYVE